MIKGIIDIGTNSVRVLVVDDEQQMKVLYNDLAMTRIGEGLGVERIIKEVPLKRTVERVKYFVERCNALGVDRIRITATSAVRDAKNKEEVKQLVEQSCGERLEILPGPVEARMSYLGASGDFLQDGILVAVLDIGGGSTELVYPSAEGIICRSVNVGAVRLLENEELRPRTMEILGGLIVEKPTSEIKLVGVGGTITTLVAMELKMETYDPDLVHGYRLTKNTVDCWYDRLKSMDLEMRKKLPGLQAQRADIIPHGVAILKQAMELLDQEDIIVSEKDILLGCIYTME